MNVTTALRRLIKQAGGENQFRQSVGIKSRQLLFHYLKTGRVASPETCAHIRHTYGVDLYPPVPYSGNGSASPAKPRKAKGQN